MCWESRALQLATSSRHWYTSNFSRILESFPVEIDMPKSQVEASLPRSMSLPTLWWCQYTHNTWRQTCDYDSRNLTVDGIHVYMYSLYALWMAQVLVRKILPRARGQDIFPRLVHIRQIHHQAEWMAVPSVTAMLRIWHRIYLVLSICLLGA